MRIVLIASILFTSVACTNKTIIVQAPKQSPKSAPPGQVKKATGAKSAKAYAPGQQKNHHHKR